MGARVHVARRRLAEKINVEMVGSGVSLGVKIAKILSRIAARGRAGPHDSEDEGCGCGQCCSMLAHGIVAHMEGVMASDTHFTLAKETE